MNYQHLLRPLRIGGLTLKNRLLSAPTSLAELGPREHYSPENIAYYKLRAAGGAALVTVGDVIVEINTGRSHPQQVGMDDPTILPYLVELADAIHSGGAAAGIELDHGGALCSPEFIGGKNAIGPSGYVDDWGDTVEEMTEADIFRIADAFGAAALVAKNCGFDLVMIHSGHGWLLHQFLSPLTNHRMDRWGGSIENRMRFLLLVIERVRSAVGKSFPIEVRMSGSERMEGGYDIEMGIEIAKAIDGKVDLIHVSAGTQQNLYSAVLMHPGVFQKHGENSALAAEIKKHVKIPVVTVGAFSEPDLMEQFLAAGHADAIAMGRALIADPFLPKKLMRGQENQITPCLRCGECQSSMMKNRTIRCAVNPMIGHETDFFHPIPTRICRTVLIAGGGPGGMEAAITACDRGHHVVLCEAAGQLGGALKFADSAEFKHNMLLFRENMIQKVQARPIEVRINTPLTKEMITEIAPDVLILAVGAIPMTLPIPGADGANVVFGAELKEDTSGIGETVVVIGGGLIGCETALHLAQTGHKVTVLELQEELAADCARMHKINLMHQLEQEKLITPAVGLCCTAISLEGVTAADKDGNAVFFPADTVIMAAGMISRTESVEPLRSLVPECYVIGDCHHPRQVMQAVREGYDAAVNLGL